MKRDPSIHLSPVAVKTLDLKGLKVAIVGGTGGIGRALALSLAAQGAHVLVVGQTFRDAATPGITFMRADLSLMKEAQRVARELPAETLDIVIMTTGVMAGPKREVTGEAIERDLAVSYLSRYVILKQIAPRLGTGRANPGTKPRVFVMGFPGSGQAGDVDDLNSERNYGRWKAHMNTVAGNEAIVLDARDRYPHIDAFGLNPGFVKTDIRANLFGWKWLRGIVEALTSLMTLAPEVYAERIVPLLVSSDIGGHSGAMFNNKAEAILPSPGVVDPAHRSGLLAASDALIERVQGSPSTKK
ncbi:SDR family NAD(P)-dependent oxidoreductase [Bradyrhizobium manausense]|uniref:SDR family NAD(P)-dependent oxidoreductase n=1 Tax=Bradyrhizobium TaxID=374 RepID=UPI001BA470B6|nr:MULTISPECIES: SDR family NAD(P)-dependent oxidoreductase [Bradyrhizobium]MBR0826902.1 SDR family NAD(P)-dependent oxidoreductase [Bradyrhizobium manausense]UVO32185.1 SDR family NAD(P)-dependent oxidoreductase [Bradyrhizobium arachidis]